MMKKDVAHNKGRNSLIPGISRTFVRAAYELAIRRAGRDAHRADCRLDAAECAICCEHAGRISEAKAALRRDLAV
jgi:hypothetical protein